jgi:O-antigen ligase
MEMSAEGAALCNHCNYNVFLGSHLPLCRTFGAHHKHQLFPGLTAGSIFYRPFGPLNNRPYSTTGFETLSTARPRMMFFCLVFGGNQQVTNRYHNHAASSTTPHFLSRIIQAGIIIILVVAPFPFGSVQDQWIFSWEIGICALMLLWVLVQIGSRETEWIDTRMMWPLLALIVYLLITLAPMPSQMLSAISTETSSIYQSISECFSLAGSSPPGRFTISLAPFDAEGELLKLSAYAAFFLIVLHFAKYRRGFFAVIHAIISTGAVLACLGIAQNAWFSGKIYGIFESGSGSPFGPFVNHNHFAGYMELALGLSLGMLLAEIYRFRKRTLLPGIGSYYAWIWHREGSRCWVFLASTILMIIALVASQSRGGMASFALTCVIAAIPAIVRGGKDRDSLASRSDIYFRKALISMLLLGALLVGTLLLTSGTAGRWRSIMDASARYRISIWHKGIGAISDFPATGTGLGSFSSIFPRYQMAAYTSEIGHAENEYLQWTIETGLVGLAIMAFTLFAFARLTYFRLPARKDGYYRCIGYGTLLSVTSLGIHNLSDFNTHVTSNALTFVAVAAVAIVAINYHRGQGGERLSLEIAKFPASNRKAIALICILVVSLGLISYRGWIRFHSIRLQEQWSRERPFLLQGDPDETKLALLTESYNADGWNDNAHYLKARAFESGTSGAGILQLFKNRKLLDSARNELLQALNLRPSEASYWSTLGRIEMAAMNLDAADRAFAHAIMYSSNDGYIQRDYGFFLLAKGNVTEAASRFALARTFTPSLDLEQMLKWLGAKTGDRRLWESIVRHQVPDLRTYGRFLQDRGMKEDGLHYLEEADIMEKAQRAPQRR